MGQKLTRAPVYFALAQVRFNTVLTLEQYLPPIQESFRRMGYPDFDRAIILNMNFVPTASPALPSLEQTARFQFLNENRTSGFLLEQGALTFQTTDYDTFEPFLKTMMSGLEIVHAAASLNYSQRLGVRYLDAVMPSKGEKLDQYLTPSVLGLSEKLSERHLEISVSETRTKRGATSLMSRTIIYNQEQEGVAVPPELHPIILNVADRFKRVKGQYGVIDTDSWLEERHKFDLATLDKNLRMLKENIALSFDLTVTPFAVSAWK